MITTTVPNVVIWGGDHLVDVLKALAKFQGSDPVKKVEGAYHIRVVRTGKWDLIPVIENISAEALSPAVYSRTADKAARQTTPTKTTAIKGRLKCLRSPPTIWK